MFGRIRAVAVGFALVLAFPACAETEFHLQTTNQDDALAKSLRGASLVRGVAATADADALDIFAAARADYARLVAELYDQGFYSATVSILLDGREAARIAPMDAPAQVSRVEVTIDPGPVFHFSQASIAPLAGQTDLPTGFRVPEIAHAGMISKAAQAGVDAWRDVGHAKARVARQQIVADHRQATLAADLTLDPGPVADFGTLSMQGNTRLRTDRLAEIAGYPTGKRFSPERFEAVRNRLRRTGIFSSVTLTEAETLREGNLLDSSLTVIEAKPRRIGFGGEISSTDGATVSGYWLHRNLFGGGERLRFDAEVAGIGGSTGGTDYSLATRLDRPATFTPDTSAFILASLTQKHEEDYDNRAFTLGLGLSHVFNDRLSGEAGVGTEWSQVTDATGREIFRVVTLPLALTWDNRDTPADATRGYYAKMDLMPFVGFSGTGSGARFLGDFRAYRGLGQSGRFVLAGRAQVGGIFGADLSETPRDYLFYSGGGGTVRGQPYQSLGVSVLRMGTQRTGGSRFVGLSTEMRAGVTENIGVVAFYDTAFVGADGFFDNAGSWHAGAGLGLRYRTPIGPIRLDIGAPVRGSKAGGAQIYLGIGQAF